MDSVQPVQTNSNVTGVASTNTNANTGTVDYDAFLTLLVAQLKNQDPTEPTDNAELMAQLASFSSVEQQVQINEKLETLIGASALGDAGSLIGKTVTSADGQLSGTVTAVILGEDGLIAETEGGQRIPMVPGTVIREQQNAV